MNTTARSSFVSLCVLALLAGVLTVPEAPGTYVTAATWVSHFGSTGTADGQFIAPASVAVDKWGNVFVASDNRIQKFTADGVFVARRGTSAPSPEMSQPLCVATDRWGNVYVGEAGNGGRLSRHGGLLAHEPFVWDGTQADNYVTGPTGIDVSLSGRVYVTDQTENKLQAWTPYGGFYNSRTPLGSPTTGLAVSHDEWLYTTTGAMSGITESVIRYDWWSGVPATAWGGHGTTDGLFDQPYDVAVDPLENSYVIERVGGRGQVFMADTPFLTAFGSPGSGNGQFLEPEGIALGPDRTLYVADTGNDRISKWSVSVPAAINEQVAGDDRYDTAIEAARQAYPRGAPVAVVATGANWPDALGGSALAGAAGGPILLTRRDTLPAAVLTELGRLGVEKVYVLGGEAAVSAVVFDALTAEFPPDLDHDKGGEPNVVRLGGADRYETAIEVAEEVKRLAGWEYAGTAFICTGANFPDALAAAPIAAANKWPIYLTRRDTLPANVQDSMLRAFGGNPSLHGFIIGGTSVVGPAVEAEVAETPFLGFMRIGGENRYDTSAQLARIAYNGMGMVWSRPAIATGESFPDALAGSALQGRSCSPILLARPTVLPSETAAVLAEYEEMVYQVRFLGGTQAIDTAVRNEVRTILGLPW